MIVITNNNASIESKNEYVYLSYYRKAFMKMCFVLYFKQTNKNFQLHRDYSNFMYLLKNVAQSLIIKPDVYYTYNR